MAAKSAKKNTQPESTNVIDTTVKAVGDMVEKAQDQYWTMVERSQTATIEGFEAIVSALGKVELPSIPGVDRVMPDADAMKIPADALDGWFEFNAKVIENQREFAQKLFATAQR